MTVNAPKKHRWHTLKYFIISLALTFHCLLSSYSYLWVRYIVKFYVWSCFAQLGFFVCLTIMFISTKVVNCCLRLFCLVSYQGSPITDPFSMIISLVAFKSDQKLKFHILIKLLPYRIWLVIKLLFNLPSQSFGWKKTLLIVILKHQVTKQMSAYKLKYSRIYLSQKTSRAMGTVFIQRIISDTVFGLELVLKLILWVFELSSSVL